MSFRYQRRKKQSVRQEMTNEYTDDPLRERAELICEAMSVFVVYRDRLLAWQQAVAVGLQAYDQDLSERYQTALATACVGLATAMRNFWSAVELSSRQEELRKKYPDGAQPNETTLVGLFAQLNAPVDLPTLPSFTDISGLLTREEDLQRVMDELDGTRLNQEIDQALGSDADTVRS